MYCVRFASLAKFVFNDWRRSVIGCYWVVMRWMNKYGTHFFMHQNNLLKINTQAHTTQLFILLHRFDSMYVFQYCTSTIKPITIIIIMSAHALNEGQHTYWKSQVPKTNSSNSYWSRSVCSILYMLQLFGGALISWSVLLKLF